MHAEYIKVAKAGSGWDIYALVKPFGDSVRTPWYAYFASTNGEFEADKIIRALTPAPASP